MTETITTDTRYGFDDMHVGDVVRIASGPHEAITGTVSKAAFGEQPEVTAFGEVFDVYREHAIELIHRPDPVADLVQMWTARHPGDKAAQIITDNARETVRSHWPHLAEALDRVAKA